METITYTNSNGDVVLIDLINDGSYIVAVWLFGCNIKERLSIKELSYLYSLVP